MLLSEEEPAEISKESTGKNHPRRGGKSTKPGIKALDPGLCSDIDSTALLQHAICITEGAKALCH